LLRAESGGRRAEGGGRRAEGGELRAERGFNLTEIWVMRKGYKME